MTRAMYRYQVELGGPVTIGLTSDPVSFGALGCSAGIEFWAEHDDAKPEVPRTFVIVGTGHPVPAGASYAGSAPRTPEGLVWHLFELGAVPSLIIKCDGEITEEQAAEIRRALSAVTVEALAAVLEGRRILVDVDDAQHAGGGDGMWLVTPARPHDLAVQLLTAVDKRLTDDPPAKPS